MRSEDLNALSEPYTDLRVDIDRRFNSAIGADVPSVTKLTEEIFNDLDEVSLGISWWRLLPDRERILVSDYLYQCVTGIEVNIAEAKLHLMEWTDVREQQNGRVADIVQRDERGRPYVQVPSSVAPVDDLPNRLESLHICGFLRAIGSSLDCLGAVLIGVLGLVVPLRRCDIRKAEKALLKVQSTDAGSKLQADFAIFFEDLKQTVGPLDWLEWADQYRNMYVHRGRRMTFSQIVPRKTTIFDAHGQIIPRTDTVLHLAKYPDRSEVEALVKGPHTTLNEDAEVTLNGIFRSCRELQEHTCENLIKVWGKRRNNPNLIQQPISQWDINIRPCRFTGYEPNTPFNKGDFIISNPIFHRRFVAASIDDAHMRLWNSSPWD
ncbi:MAG TPA: hypothetical protein VHQ94_13325 [Pyrinomonadaceae bacterium]|jgi:hypothetical protein|nr:hypothetical protein [Pyrinomonadaceae bacterium]